MEKKKNILVGIAAAVLLVALFLVLLGPPENPIDAEIRIDRILRAGTTTQQGRVSVSFTREGPAYRYINVGVSVGEAFVWLVQNQGVDVYATSGVSSYPVTLPETLGGDAENIPAVAMVSEAPIADWDGQLRKQVGVTTTIERIGQRDVEKGVSRDRETQKETGSGLLLGGIFAQAASTAGEEAGSRIRVDDPNPGETTPGYVNIQLDGVNDTPQEFNECAPTAASNALDWLADVYDIEDQMPTDTEGLIDELKGDMQWDGGVSPGDGLPGIQNFINRRNLPFEAHQIDPSDNLFWDMVEEMQKGQILLASLQYYKRDNAESEWERDGAHLTTIVGISGNATDGMFIHTHDSGDVEAEASKDIERLEGTQFATDYDSNTKTEVRYVIAISPIQNEDGTLVSPGSGTGSQGEGSMTQGSTTSSSAFAFFSVTFDPVGDHFVGESFSARVQVAKTGEDQWIFWSGESLKVEAGSPWNISGRFTAAGPIEPTSIEDAPPQTNIGEGTTTYTVNQTFTCADVGAATITYRPTLGWQTIFNKDPIPEAIAETYGDQLVPNDTMSVTSPPFNCLATEEMVLEEESRTAYDRRATFCPGVDTVYAGDDVRDIGVYKGPGDECYPDFQFNVAGPDACEENHYHAVSERTAYSLTGAAWGDPNPDGCGYGVDGSLEHEVVTVSQTLLTQYLGGVFSN